MANNGIESCVPLRVRDAMDYEKQASVEIKKNRDFDRLEWGYFLFDSFNFDYLFIHNLF